MAKRKSTNVRRNQHRDDLMLQVTLGSPRILFYQALRLTRGLVKFVIVVGLIVGSGWFIVDQANKHLTTNEKFTMHHLNVKTNGYFTQQRVAEIGGIDINGSIFALDIDEVEQKLRSLPEVVEVDVQRRIPDTIEVTLEERVPVAWIACPPLGIAGRNPLSGILVDAQGIVFRCEGGLWDVARELPVIELITADKDAFILGEPMSDKDTARAMALLQLISTRVEDGWRVKRIVVSKFNAMEVYTSMGVRARFGMYEHERQLNDLLAALAHAASINRELEWIDLLPRHNIPGGYKNSETVSSGSDANSSF